MPNAAANDPMPSTYAGNVLVRCAYDQSFANATTKNMWDKYKLYELAPSAVKTLGTLKPAFSNEIAADKIIAAGTPQ